MELGETTNCGMKELYNLPLNPASAVRFVKARLDIPGIVVFSDTRERARGEALRTYINSRSTLGRVVRSSYVRNAASGSMIAAFVWTVPETI
jgi:hypothetical protein